MPHVTISSTMAFNLAKIASSVRIVTKSSMISLRVRGLNFRTLNCAVSGNKTNGVCSQNLGNDRDKGRVHVSAKKCC